MIENDGFIVVYRRLDGSPNGTLCSTFVKGAAKPWPEWIGGYRAAICYVYPSSSAFYL